MKYKLYFLLIILTNFCPNLHADRVKAALKQLEKGELEKARELIEKDLEKDSINAGAHYVFSLYFANSNNPYYHIDSAYVFILNAIHFFPQTEEKVIAGWNKIQVNDSSFQVQKEIVESLAYDWAMKVNQIVAYQHFIDFYVSAQQVPDAIRLRDELAWQQTLKQNTLEGFQSFLDTYPEAVQFLKAKNKRDQFIYERETKENTLQSYEFFIQKYPDNDFREEAEQHVFEIFTVSHNLETYEEFIQKYPTNPFLSKAYDWLFTFMIQNKNIEAFHQKYINTAKESRFQSFSTLEQEVFLPVYQNGKYGFVGISGNIRIEPKFEQIIEDYRCESIEDFYILFIQNQKQGLMNKRGEVLIAASFDQIENLGNGIFKTKIGEEKGAYHWVGFEILPTKFQAIEILAGKYLIVKEDEKWGIYSMNGRQLLKPQFDAIKLLGDNFVSLQKNGKYLVKHKNRLSDWMRNPEVNVEVNFETVSLKTPDFVEVEKNGKKSILNLEEELILPFQKSEINYLEGAWGIRKDSLYQEAFTHSGKKIDLDSIQAIVANQKFIALKKEDAWLLYDSDGKNLITTPFDSIALFRDITLFFQKRAIWASFQNGLDSINLSQNRDIKVIGGHYPNAKNFLTFKAKNNRWGLLNPLGEECIKAIYQDISVLDSNLIIVKSGQLEGLLNFKGDILLKTEYEGISQLSNTYLGLLRYRKFGLFHPEKNILIPTNYDVIPEPYSEKGQYFITQKNGNIGLINSKNETMIPFDFEEIQLWQPEVALVKQEDTWQFYDIQNKKILKEVSFEGIQFIKSTLEEVIFIPNQENTRFGLWNSQVGEVLTTEYDWIENIGSVEKPIFWVETQSKKKKNYQVQYLSTIGELIWESNLTEEGYEALLCP